MYIKEVQKILNKHSSYLEIVGVKAGITKIPYRLHGDYFIEIANMNERQLEQAANLMSKNYSTFTRAATKRLKHFAGEMGGEYAERSAGVIDALAKLKRYAA